MCGVFWVQVGGVFVFLEFQKIQGDFCHWYPPPLKSKKYGKPMLGESMLT